MKLDRNELIALRKNGDLSNKDFFIAVKALVEDSPVAEVPKADPIESIVKALSSITMPASSPSIDHSALLSAIEEQLKALAKATAEATAQRSKKRELFPTYQDGRIVKITIV